MPFKKGDPRPPGAGRKKGTPNKATAPIREAIAAKDPIGKLFEIVENTEDEDLRVRALLGVLPYGFPRLAASQVDLKSALMGNVTLKVNLNPSAEKRD